MELKLIAFEFFYRIWMGRKVFDKALVIPFVLLLILFAYLSPLYVVSGFETLITSFELVFTISALPIVYWEIICAEMGS